MIDLDRLKALSGMLVPLGRAAARRGSPVYLIQFVTDRCNARCDFCFSVTRRGPEMTVDDYARFTPTLGRLLYLSLTGGEPFLRTDLGEIIDLYVRATQPRVLLIPTNGFFPERVEAVMGAATARHPGTSFEMSVSVDAIGAEHDRLRRLDGLFDRVVETLRTLRALARRRENFHFGANLTLGEHNLDSASDTVDHLFDHLKMRNVTLNIARDNRPRALPSMDPERLLQIYRKVEARIDRDRGGFSHLDFGPLLNRVRKARRGYLLDLIASNGRSAIPCTAGRVSAVIDSRGNVSSCEPWPEPMGNVVAEGHDFPRVFEGEKAERIRAAIRDTRCHCTHECFNNVNMMFTPQGLLRTARGG